MENWELKFEDVTPMLVYQKNELIRASYRLTLNELRLLACAMSKITRESKVQDRVFVTAKDMLVVGCSKACVYSEMKAAAELLFNRELVFTEKDRSAVDLVRWVQAVKYEPEAGRVSLLFSDPIFPYLIDMKENFTIYELHCLQAIKSAHSLRLFQLWTSVKKLPFYQKSFEELKTMLGLTNKYDKFSHFKTRILDPAVAQCWKAGLSVTYDLVKDGPRVIAIRFLIREVAELTNDSESDSKPAVETVIKLNGKQAMAYAEKLLGPKSGDKHAYYNELRKLGFSLRGVTSVQDEISILAAWLRNHTNATKAIEILRKVGFRTRRR